MSQYASSYINPIFAPTPVDPLAGGALSIGRTGLNGIASLPQLGPLPYANPLGSLSTQLAGPAGLPRLGVTGAEMAGDAAALRPLASSLAPMSADVGLAAQLGRAAGGSPFALAEGVGMRGLLGRAGMGAFAGQIGSSVIDRLNPGGQNSNIEQGLQGAAQGAGIGGAIGSVVPGLGTGIGAAIGGAAGGALGVLTNMFGGGGDDEKESQPEEVLANAMTQANLTPDMTEQILTSYDTLMALADGLEGDQKKAAQQQAFDQVSQLILQAMQTQTAAPAAANNTLALQMQAQRIFEPIAQDITTNANLYAQAMQGIRPNLPESYRAVSDATVARELTSADKLANAYRAQAAITPVAQQLTRYQQDQDAYAQQLWSQMLAQQAAGATGGGLSGGTSDLLSQLQPA